MIDNIIENQIDWTEIVAAVVVIYSAALSTFNFIRDVDRDRYKAKLSSGIQYEIPGPGTPYIFVNLGNICSKPIIITEAGLYIKGIKERLAFFNDNVKLPSTVESGNSINSYTRLSEIESILNKYGIKKKTVKVRPYFRDALGKEYRGKYKKHVRGIL